MIPKILHFIWFGNTIPKYVNFSINMFKCINPTYNIHFIHKTIYELEHMHINSIDDDLLMKCILAICNKSNKFINTINHCKRSYITFIQILADVYRLELLSYYGGIYLDCDCFPIKPFDDQILSKKQFIVTRHYNNNIIVNDNYFLGSIPYGQQFDCELWNFYDTQKTNTIIKILQTSPGWWKNINFFKLKRRFFNTTLSYGEYISDNTFYIDHYNALSWKTNNTNRYKTPSCIYDKYI